MKVVVIVILSWLCLLC
jgi:hypothetical protein